MHIWWWGWGAVYFVAQGGALAEANTIYVWPTLALSQDEEVGFSFPNGVSYGWLITTSWIFWTAGLAWGKK